MLWYLSSVFSCFAKYVDLIIFQIMKFNHLELLPILAIETLPFWRRPDGVTGVTGVRPPDEEVREPFPGVPGVRASLELLPGVPGVRGVRAGVPGNSPDPPLDRLSIFERTWPG
jgi:hypothetical protein